MSRKILFILCLLLFSLVIIPFSYADSDDNAMILSLKNAWEKSECETMSTNLSIYAKLDNAFIEVEEMESVLTDLFTLFNLPENPIIEWSEYEGYREGTVVHELAKDDFLSLSVQSFYGESDDDSETNVMINIDGGQDINKLLEYQRLIENSLQTISATGQLNCSILGMVESETSEEVIEIISKLVEHMQCDIKDFYVDNQVISLCGNSPLLDDQPYGWSFNMQISARKDENGKYYLWLGYPAIASSY